MAKQTVVVAGASGYLGRYVVSEFSARGYGVRALVRSREKLAGEGPNLEPAVAELVDEVFIGDAADSASLKDSPARERTSCSPAWASPGRSTA